MLFSKYIYFYIQFSHPNPFVKINLSMKQRDSNYIEKLNISTESYEGDISSHSLSSPKSEQKYEAYADFLLNETPG